MANAGVSVGSSGLGRHAWERIAERGLLLQAVSARPAAAACEWSRSRLGSQPSPARTGGASAAHVPAANLRPPLSASKLKPGTAGRDGSSTSDMPSPRSKLSTSDGKGVVHCRALSLLFGQLLFLRCKLVYGLMDKVLNNSYWFSFYLSCVAPFLSIYIVRNHWCNATL